MEQLIPILFMMVLLGEVVFLGYSIIKGKKDNALFGGLLLVFTALIASGILFW